LSQWSELYISEVYKACWDYSHPSPELVDFVAECPVPPGAVTLDIGCGSGQDAVFLAEQGYQSHGLDICPEALDLGRRLARRHEVEVTWHHGDALAMPLADGMFDLITDRGCLHHVPDADRPAYAAETARLLKPGGWLFLRGAATRMLSFVPVTAEALRQTFPADTFTLISARPFPLVADVLSMDGTMAVLRRRP
jgi:ubiquinone/menaquinone biosynthesis C-methylase UbiE